MRRSVLDRSMQTICECHAVVLLWMCGICIATITVDSYSMGEARISVLFWLCFLLCLAWTRVADFEWEADRVAETTLGWKNRSSLRRQVPFICGQIRNSTTKPVHRILMLSYIPLCFYSYSSFCEHQWIVSQRQVVLFCLSVSPGLGFLIWAGYIGQRLVSAVQADILFECWVLREVKSYSDLRVLEASYLRNRRQLHKLRMKFARLRKNRRYLLV